MSVTANGPLPCEGPTRDFYCRVLLALDAATVPYLMGGAYALQLYAGIQPHTKDLDLFIRREHLDLLREAVTAAGCPCEVTFPHWLAKVFSDGDAFVDVIFSSGNGLCVVDDGWFEHARYGTVAGRSVRLCPPEEMIWSKAFVMERERFDGADIAHFLRHWAGKLDWERLLERFGPHGRVLLCHVVLFGYVYPDLRSTVPDWVLQELIARVQQEQNQQPSADMTCFGTMLSREQYLPDIRSWGYSDARLAPLGTMSPIDVAQWTDAIEERKGKRD